MRYLSVPIIGLTTSCLLSDENIFTYSFFFNLNATFVYLGIYLLKHNFETLNLTY